MLSDIELIKRAEAAMKLSYSPYSHFCVGAALLCCDSSVYTGCNIENSSYSVANCAERTAFYSAVAAANKRFSKIAIVGGKNGFIEEYCSPCGVCRQVMSEFCDENFEILLWNGKTIKKYTLAELLPNAFGGEML